jgi:hypothetical protein
MRLATIISNETEMLAVCSSAGLVPMDVLNGCFRHLLLVIRSHVLATTALMP